MTAVRRSRIMHDVMWDASVKCADSQSGEEAWNHDACFGLRLGVCCLKAGVSVNHEPLFGLPRSRYVVVVYTVRTTGASQKAWEDDRESRR